MSEMGVGLEASIRSLKGVGDRRAGQFARLGIATLGDLIRHYPRAYEDWSAVVPIAAAGMEPCCIRATAVTDPQERRIPEGTDPYTPSR